MTGTFSVEIPPQCKDLKAIAEKWVGDLQNSCIRFHDIIGGIHEEIKKQLTIYNKMREDYFLAILEVNGWYWCGYCNRAHPQEPLPEKMFFETTRVVINVCSSCQEEIRRRSHQGDTTCLRPATEREILLFLKKTPDKIPCEIAYRYEIPPEKHLVGEMFCTLKLEDVSDVH